MLQEGQAAKVVAEERQDYIGKEQVQLTDSGRPIMNFRTVRDDGEDVAVLAPVATANFRKD
jgi:hypothetical protein